MDDKFWMKEMKDGTWAMYQKGKLSIKETTEMGLSIKEPIDIEAMNKDTFRRLYGDYTQL